MTIADDIYGLSSIKDKNACVSIVPFDAFGIQTTRVIIPIHMATVSKVVSAIS